MLAAHLALSSHSQHMLRGPHTSQPGICGQTETQGAHPQRCPMEPPRTTATGTGK